MKLNNSFGRVLAAKNEQKANSGLIVGKDNMRVTNMGMKTTINPKPGHYMNCSEPLNNILGAVLASRCIIDLNQ